MSDIIKLDKDFVWHPYTQHQTERDPVAVTRARGASLYDEDGNEILDLISSWWTSIHGHAHPALVETLANQASELEHVMFAGFAHEPAGRLAEALGKILPGDLERVFYSDNGSTAVEVALKIAYQFHRNNGDNGRTEFIAMEGGYHGDTLGAMSVGRGCAFFTLFDELMCEAHPVPYAETWDGDKNVEAREDEALAALARHLESRGDKTAALIIEPLMQGAGGIRFARPEFVCRLSEMAHEAGALVIYDEVATGFGRTGTMFACEQIAFTPDLVCLSKGLTAGVLPMSVTVATKRVFDAFLDGTFNKALAHGHTFTAYPLACAVALRSLALFEEEQTLSRIKEIEQRHRAQLTSLSAHPRVDRPRVMGTMLAFNLSGASGVYKAEDGEKLRDWFLIHGLNIRPIGSAVYIMPPYCITDDELDRAYAGLLEGLESL